MLWPQVIFAPTSLWCLITQINKRSGDNQPLRCIIKGPFTVCCHQPISLLGASSWRQRLPITSQLLTTPTNAVLIYYSTTITATLGRRLKFKPGKIHEEAVTKEQHGGSDQFRLSQRWSVRTSRGGDGGGVSGASDTSGAVKDSAALGGHDLDTASDKS